MSNPKKSKSERRSRSKSRSPDGRRSKSDREGRGQEDKTDEKKEEGDLPQELTHLKFYHGYLPREHAEDLLDKQGHFLVRLTQLPQQVQKKVCISVLWNNEPLHYIVHHTTQDGVQKCNIEKNNYFESVTHLINHYRSNKKPIAEQNGAQLLTPVKKQPWELNHEQIQYQEKLGQGEFGEVFRAKLLRGWPRRDLDVAVKQTVVRTREERDKFLSEAFRMRAYDHPNIVKLVGVVVHRDPLLIVMELAPGGSLLDRLHKHKEKIGQSDRIQYCVEAARGMEYLENRKCIHRDVAARNCLLGAKGEVKISDFGLSHQTDIYTVNTQKRLPIRWLSPETLTTKKYTAKSDVWSFGILIWEIYSNGKEPYSEINWKHVQKHVVKGNRMKAPPGMNKEIAQLMEKCWRPDNERPTFKDLVKILEKISKPLMKKTIGAFNQ